MNKSTHPGHLWLIEYHLDVPKCCRWLFWLSSPPLQPKRVSEHSLLKNNGLPVCSTQLGLVTFIIPFSQLLSCVSSLKSYRGRRGMKYTVCDSRTSLQLVLAVLLTDRCSNSFRRRDRRRKTTTTKKTRRINNGDVEF